MTFWRTVSEFLVSGPSLDGPPFTFRFDLLVEGPGIEEVELTAITTVMEAITRRLSVEHVQLEPYATRTPDSLSRRDYRNVWLLPSEASADLLADGLPE
jgi:hypothetical protein